MPHLRDSYVFQRRLAAAVQDGLDRPGGWGAVAPDAYGCSAETIYLKGSEAVQAARLQGDQPVMLTIRASAAARLIDNTWRAVDARDPARILEVTAASITPDRIWVQVLAVQRRGDADG